MTQPALIAQAEPAGFVTAPGIFDIPADLYHSDPVPGGSLSNSGATKLLPPHCPARFKYDRDHPGHQSTRDMDFGNAAHRMVLGAGHEVVLVDADSYRTKAAQQARDEAQAAGHIPLLPDEHAKADAMAAAVRAHPIAGPLFDPDRGDPERSLFWVDKDTSVWRRARLDWLTHARPGARLIIGDYKTTKSASQHKLDRTIDEYGYHRQAATYIDGVIALGLDADPAYLLVFQEKTPPYLVNVVEPIPISLEIGRWLNTIALHTYRECTRTDTWPGYSDGIELVGLPPWVINLYESLKERR